MVFLLLFFIYLFSYCLLHGVGIKVLYDVDSDVEQFFSFWYRQAKTFFYFDFLYLNTNVEHKIKNIQVWIIFEHENSFLFWTVVLQLYIFINSNYKKKLPKSYFGIIIMICM